MMTFEQIKTTIIDSLNVKERDKFEEEFKKLMIENIDFPTKEALFYQLINKYKSI